MSTLQDIIGSGGKGGGSSFTEQNNTIRTHARVKAINLISEGEIEGIAGGAKGIYFNSTPLENADGVRNFPGVEWDWRSGLPAQTAMSGFPGASANINVNTNVTNAAPVVRATTAANIDAVRVMLTFTSGLMEQDTGSGSLKQTTVSYALDRRVPTGSWTQVGDVTLTEKVNTPFQKVYLIERPVGSSGVWEYRVRRVSADGATSNIQNSFQLSNVVEIINKSETYANSAVVGLSLLAESFGNQFPKVGFLTKGLLIQIPSNYNPVTRVYTGIWNGSFVKSTVAVDNPAWVLYDLITNTRYGAGSVLGTSEVDPFSFYAAAVYCDQMVNNGEGGTEPRFTFNFPLTSRDVGLRLINAVAGAMRARLVTINGLLTVLQDRPASVDFMFNNTNVVDGLFSYSSAPLQDRHTAFNITYQNKRDFYSATIVTVDSSTIGQYASNYATALTAAESLYGYELTEITAYGATTPGQAIRAGLYVLDTELYQTELVTFKTADRMAAGLLPNQIVEIYDQDFVGQSGAGRVLSSTSTSVTLDRPVTLVAGSKIKVLLADGKTIEERNIVETIGTVSTVTVTTTFSQALHENSIYTVVHANAARAFRVLSITQADDGAVAVEGVFHDPNKYSRIEQNLNVPAPTYATVTATRCGPIGAISFTRADVNNSSEGLNGVRRQLNVAWAPPALGVAVKYIGQWRHITGNWVQFEARTQNFTIDPAYPGLYEVQVSAVSSTGIVGPMVLGTHTVDVTGGGASALVAPISLAVSGGGATFAGPDLNFQWTNPSANLATVATLRDFEVRFIETVGGTLLRTVYVPAVAAGGTQTTSYTYSMNTADGGPRRSIKVEVRCRDTSNNLSAAVFATFTNPAPAAITVTAAASVSANFIKMTRPTDADFAGFIVWASTTPDFVPAVGNKIYEGDGESFTHSALADSQTWYYKAAAYDQFGKAYNGTGLNVSTQATGTTLSGVTVNEYELSGVTWTPNSPSANSVSWSACTAIKTNGASAGTTWAVTAGSAAWTSGVLYVYYTEGGTTLTSTTTLSTAIAANKIIVASYRGGTNLEIGNGRAYTDGSFVIAGTVGAAQLVTGTAVITQGAQIANAIIGNAKITDLDGGKIVANTVTATQIDSRNLNIKDAAGTVIFSAGVPLQPAHASSGLVNNNISIGANGVLVGAGGGAVTIGGLGYTGDLNASSDIKLNVRGAGLVLAGNSCNRPTGGGAWDSDCYSTDAYTGGAVCSFIPSGGTSSYFMAGLNSDPTTDSSYLSIDYAFYMSGTNSLFIYESGTALGAVGTYATGDVLSASYDGQFVRYMQNGNVLRTVPAPPGLKLHFDSSIVVYGLSNITLRPIGNTNSGRGTNLIDASWWNQSISPTSVWGSNFGAPDAFVVATLPDGTSGIVWRATADANGGPGGGWNSNSNVTNNFPVNTAKTYMFVVYTKGVSGTGTEYFGINGAVTNLNTTTVSGNPYFAVSAKVNGEWHMHVGYVYPAGSTGHTSVGAGTYSCSNGQLIAAGSNYNWAPGSQSAGVRAYQYYQTSGAQQYFAWPAVYLCDGSEPSLDDLLSMSVKGNIATAATTASWGGVASRPPNLAALSGSESIQNSQIIVSGGAITGIGTGSGTVVANSAISIAANGQLSGAGGGQVTIGGLGYTGDLGATNDLRMTLPPSYTQSGNRITKASGVEDWATGAVTTAAYTGGAFIQAVDEGNHFMLALTTDPSTTNGYTHLDYAFHAALGAVYVFSNGTAVYGPQPLAPGSVCAATYDGSYVRFTVNGTVFHTIAAPAGLKLYGQVSLAYTGQFCKDIRFGPYGNPSAVQPSNPITAGNASTYIANAAVNLAQINTASIGSLSAITATIGTLRTATSGARTEIADNVIRVYDSSNLLRVKIGNLS
jgi:predicted phage tail protein